MEESTQAAEEEEPRTPDFFISYTGADVGWAEWVDWHLREAGYVTVMQKYDFGIGANFILKMHEAAKDARTIALLSEKYLQSNFCKVEWSAALGKDPVSTARMLVPLRIEDCDVKGVLGPIAHADLFGIEEDEAETRLVQAVTGPYPRPDSAPGFPGRAKKTPATQRRRLPGVPPPIWNVPFIRNPNFTGRDDLLEDLREQLASQRPAALTQAISGLGGIGKTQLALEYAYRYAADYECIWWIRSEDPATMAADYASLAPKVGIEIAQDQSETVKAVRDKLGRLAKTLLIFDNAEEPGDLGEFLPQGAHRQVIITSRNPAWGGIATCMQVKHLPREESIEFLTNRTKQNEGKAADTLADLLGDLPLALEQASAFILASRMGIPEYVELFGTQRDELLKRGEATGYRANGDDAVVATTWNMAFKRISKSCPAATDLLNLLAFLAPDDIRFSDLVAGAEHLPDRLRTTVIEGIPFADARAALLRYSLVDADGESLSVHRLVQDVTRNRLDEEGTAIWTKAAVDILCVVFPLQADDVRNWPECSRLLAHAQAVTHHDIPGSVRAADLVVLMAAYFRGRAKFVESERLVRHALAIYELAFGGAEHPVVANTLGKLGLLLHETHRQEEAEPLLRRALAIREQLFGAEHRDIGHDVSNLAQLLRHTDRLEEAESLMRRALDIAEQTDHLRIAVRLNNLGELLVNTNRQEEAEPLLRRSLAIDEQSYGTEHPKVAIRLNNLARLLQGTNRLEEAEPIMRRALAIFELSYGPEHPSTNLVRKNLKILTDGLQ